MARLSSLIWTVASAALLSTQAQAVQMKVDELACGPNDFYSSANNGYTSTDTFPLSPVPGVCPRASARAAEAVLTFDCGREKATRC